MTRHAVVALTVAAAVGGLTAPTALANSAPAAPAASVPAAVPTDPVVTGATVNGGKDVVVGTTERKTFTVTVHGSDDSGLQFADVDLLGPAVGFYTTDNYCETATACTTTFTVDPHPDPYNENTDLRNANAGRWYVNTLVDTNDGASLLAKNVGGFLLKRAAALTVNAAPEPVVKGGTITVTGKLTRANWDTYRYAGLHRPVGGAPVPPEDRRHLHHREDPHDQRDGQPPYDGEGRFRRLLAVELRRYDHHGPEERDRRLRRRPLTGAGPHCRTTGASGGMSTPPGAPSPDIKTA